MNPPLAAPRRTGTVGTGAATGAAPEAAPRRDPPAVRRLGVVLALVTAAVATAFVVGGASWPPLAPVALLAAVLAFCVNRYAFFPSELAVTAEAAAVLAAVVAFSRDAPLLGPLVVAVLVGPVDMVHWEQRAFTRMAHNAGDRALAAVVAAVTFGAVTNGSVASVPLVGAGIVAATVAFAAVEVSLSVALLRLLGETGWRATVGHAVGLEALTVPIGIAGAAAGLVAIEHGWWFALLVLAPLPWVPELALRPRTGRVRRARARAATAAIGVLAAGVAVAATPTSDRVFVLVLCAGAALLGLELAVRPAAPLPVLAALAVVPVAAPAIGTPVAGVACAAAIALVVACVTWSVAGGGWWGPVLAVLGGASAALVARVCEPTDSLTRTWCGVASAVVFGSVAVAAGRDRGRLAARALWTTPLVLAVALLGAVPGGGRVVGVIAVIAVGLTASAAVGSPPWDSRLLAGVAWVRSARPGGVVMLAVILAGAAALLACTSLVATGAHDTMFLVAGAIAEVLLGMAMVATRQWRFAPAARRRDAVVSAALAVAVATLYVRLAWVANGWSLLVMGVALAWAIRVVVPLRRIHARDAAREPVSR
jgi:hypothetical protein